MNTISPEHLAKYFRITENALKAATARANANAEHAAQIMRIATQYTQDARHFEQKGDIVRAFAALNYAHGWLDCGCALGLITGKGSDLERWEGHS